MGRSCGVVVCFFLCSFVAGLACVILDLTPLPPPRDPPRRVSCPESVGLIQSIGGTHSHGLVSSRPAFLARLPGQTSSMGFAIGFDVCTILRPGTATDTDSCARVYIVSLTHVLGVKVHTDIIPQSCHLEPSLQDPRLYLGREASLLVEAECRYTLECLRHSNLAKTCSKAPNKKEAEGVGTPPIERGKPPRGDYNVYRNHCRRFVSLCQEGELSVVTDLFPNIGNEGSVAVRHLSLDLIGLPQVPNAQPRSWEVAKAYHAA